MTFRVRPAEAADCNTLAALWHESWHDAHARLVPAIILHERTLISFRMRLDELISDSLVAEIAAGDKMATIGGFVTVIGNEVDQLFVARAWRGRGCADVLLTAAEERLRRSGVDQAVIHCSVGNDRGAAFYKKHGYDDTGVQDAPLWRPAGRETVTHATHIFARRLG